MIKYTVKEFAAAFEEGDIKDSYVEVELDDKRVFSVFVKENGISFTYLNKKFNIDLMGDDKEALLKEGFDEFDEVFKESTLGMLKELQVELNQQDDLSTASPVYWVIRDVEYQQTDYDFSDDSVYYRDGEEYTSTDVFEDLYETKLVENEGFELFVKENPESRLAIAVESDYVSASDLEMIMDQSYSDYGFSLYNFLDENGYEEIYVKEVKKDVEGTIFLTHEAALEHLRLNRHHYSDKARAYARSAFRSPELELVWEVLRKIKI